MRALCILIFYPKLRARYVRFLLCDLPVLDTIASCVSASLCFLIF